MKTPSQVKIPDHIQSWKNLPQQISSKAAIAIRSSGSAKGTIVCQISEKVQCFSNAGDGQGRLLRSIGL